MSVSDFMSTSIGVILRGYYHDETRVELFAQSGKDCSRERKIQRDEGQKNQTRDAMTGGRRSMSADRTMLPPCVSFLIEQ